MSAAVYREPYRLPAGLLALAVHGVFFALLYFGFTWQKQPPATMSVELWQSLPDIEQETKPAVKPPPPPKAEPQPKPEPQKIEAKPDIVLPEKKKPEPVPKPVEVKPVEKKETAPPRVEQPVVSEAERQAERERAERIAATGRVVDEYTAKIAARIRSRIVLPPDVPDNARAEFRVTLLPGGSVLKAELKRSSGHAAYDSAVERAIFKAQPLPLPPDAALFNRFRELNLGFQPKE